MIKYKKSTVEVPASIICDVCKKEHSYNSSDIWESQEFQSIRIEGGYGSVFGDGEKVKLDICQHCLKKFLGKYFVKDKEDK